jgi:hypothetical protein
MTVTQLLVLIRYRCCLPFQTLFLLYPGVSSSVLGMFVCR